MTSRQNTFSDQGRGSYGDLCSVDRKINQFPIILVGFEAKLSTQIADVEYNVIGLLAIWAETKNGPWVCNMTSISSNLERIADSIAEMNHQEVQNEIVHFQGTFELDFTQEFLDSQSVEQLRHILMAAHFQQLSHN